MTVRTRLMIVTVLGLALTTVFWGWIQLRAFDRILVDEQGKVLHSVAETVGTYYQHFPTGRGLSVLENALKDHLEADTNLARIDIISVGNGDIDYIASVGRVPHEWQWTDILGQAPFRTNPRYMKLDTDDGPALGLLYPIPGGKDKTDQDFVGVIVFSRSNVEILSRAKRLLFFSTAGLLCVMLLFLFLSYGWLIGRPLRIIIQAIDEFQTGQYVRRVPLLRRDDEWGQVAAHFNSMAADIEQVMASNRELTRALEERITEATLKVVQLQKEVNQLQQLTALGYLTATLAHDLGTPLHSIAGLATLLLERGQWPPDVNRKLELIVQQTQRLNTVIQNVRHVTRLPEPRLEAIGASELLRETMPLIEPLMQRSGVRFRIEVEEHLPPLFVDRYRVQTALFNLVENALEALGTKGEISIVAYADRRHPPAVAIAVGDTGPGIPPELMKRVCEPFFSTHENEGLRGLGLAIVHDIAKAHGGRVEIESDPGAGTRVTLYFPVVDIAAAAVTSGDNP